MTDQIHSKSIEWDFLLDQIREAKCLVILGPEIYLDADGQTTQARLLQSLDLTNNKHIKRHYPGDDFYLFDQKYHRTQFSFQIQKFYRDEQPGELISLLSDIPFHVFLTITPDLLLRKIFEEKNYAFQHGFYIKNTKPQPIHPPTANNSLIYNFFGCIENLGSLVLSYDDLYDYFKSIFKWGSMPEEFKDELGNIQNLLFLGVPFDKWYFQILLRELGIHKQQSQFSRLAANQSVSDELSTFCFEQFYIQFVDEDIDEFVRELHRRCAADPKISFRESMGPKIDIKDFIRQKIARGEIEYPIEYLTYFWVHSPLQGEALNLSGRFGRLKKRRIGGLLSTEEITVEENRIQNDLLDLVKKTAISI